MLTAIDRQTIHAIHTLTEGGAATNYRSVAAELGLTLMPAQKRIGRLEALGLLAPHPPRSQNTVRLHPSIVVIEGDVYRMEKIA